MAAIRPPNFLAHVLKHVSAASSFGEKRGKEPVLYISPIARRASPAPSSSSEEEEATLSHKALSVRITSGGGSSFSFFLIFFFTEEEARGRGGDGGGGGGGEERHAFHAKIETLAIRITRKTEATHGSTRRVQSSTRDRMTSRAMIVRRSGEVDIVVVISPSKK
jgi:hypothetical protein